MQQPLNYGRFRNTLDGLVYEFSPCADKKNAMVEHKRYRNGVFVSSGKQPLDSYRRIMQTPYWEVIGSQTQ